MIYLRASTAAAGLSPSNRTCDQFHHHYFTWFNRMIGLLAKGCGSVPSKRGSKGHVMWPWARRVTLGTSCHLGHVM